MMAWIGLCDVRPLRGNDVLEGANGAFVNVVALAESGEGFQRLVCKTMREYQFSVEAIEDIVTVEGLQQRDGLIPELLTLAQSLTDEYPIQFDEFQSYEE